MEITESQVAGVLRLPGADLQQVCRVLVGAPQMGSLAMCLLLQLVSIIICHFKCAYIIDISLSYN
jgi:hypothetical protein